MTGSDADPSVLRYSSWESTGGKPVVLRRDRIFHAKKFINERGTEIIGNNVFEVKDTASGEGVD